MKTTFAWIAVVHSTTFCLFWMTNRGYHPQVNDFLKNMLGYQTGYVALFIGFGLLVTAVSVITLVSGPGRSSILYWLNAILGALFVIFFYGGFIALFREDPTQVERLKLAWRYFRLLPDALLLLALAWGISRLLQSNLNEQIPFLNTSIARWVGIVITFALWIIPLLRPPGSVFRGVLPPRPYLIAHRGASWLAPENTLPAMARAVELNAFGLESDVHISQDGVLFLMHDQSLDRTTNISEVFPERQEDHAATFSWEELSKLNAGTWFVSDDPLGTIKAGQSAQDQIDEYKDTGIPSLETLLDLASGKDQIVLYDMYDPPEDHPYHNQSLDRSLETLGRADLGNRAWVLVEARDIKNVKGILPNATLVAGIDATHPPDTARLMDAGYHVVNSEYPLKEGQAAAYQSAGLWVNLWTVDEPWLFSRCWLMGVDSVTTNNLQGLQRLSRPYLALSMPVYTVIWVGLGLVAAWLLRGLFRG